jgi:hypothetical protein
MICPAEPAAIVVDARATWQGRGGEGHGRGPGRHGRGRGPGASPEAPAGDAAAGEGA